MATLASADGNGSPADCLGGPSVDGNADFLQYDAGSGNTVDGVCIKSGSNMFNGNKHSDVLGNGTYENGCYEVAGVDTQVVTVTRLLDGNTCQGISHIDIITSVCSDCVPCTEDCGPSDPCEENPESCEPVLDCNDPDYAAQNPEECSTIQLCIDGDFVTVPGSEDLTDTGDCGPVRLCVDGESITVTKFDAENDPNLQDADDGSCTPFEPPPPPTEVPPTPAPPTEEVAGVQEEAPVEEVAALPASGYGSTSSGGSSGLSLLLAVGLMGIGGGSFAVARRKG